MAVELEGVSKTFGAVRALVNVSVRFEEAAAASVEGPNGSGKSTLLGIVGTLSRATSGRVSHGDLGRTRAEVRRALGWLGHESLCYADLTGRENIALAARLYGEDVEAALARACERFDLSAFAGRPLRTYSRGQRQRVALARALVHRPRLLLLDEPTTGLDASSTTKLVQVVREEVAGGATVIVVTHDRSFAEAIGACRIELERGRRAQ